MMMLGFNETIDHFDIAHSALRLSCVKESHFLRTLEIKIDVQRKK